MNFKKLFVIISWSLGVSLLAKAQVVTTDPEFPTATDAVTVTFDATGSALEGYTGDLYVHTGVTIDGVGRWQNVIGTWGNNDTQPQLTRTSTDMYSLEISSSINEYYGVETGDKVTELCFVFRSADGNTQTSDIFVDVYEPGLNLSITSPTNDFIMLPGESVAIEASASNCDSMFLYIDDAFVTKIEGTNITYNHTENTAGSHKIEIIAKNSEDEKSDSVFYFVRGAVNEAEIPEGWQKGINYLDTDSVGLVLFAPYKEFVFVIGDFTDWRLQEDFMMNKTSDGEYYWLSIGGLTAKQEYIFQYYIDGELRIADPYAEKISDPNDKYITEDTYPSLIDYPEGKTSKIAAVLQTDQDGYQWTSSDFTVPETENLIIYELLIRDFLAKHDYKTLSDTLDYLDSLGINAIELMPFNEFEGNESWGYNPSFYFAPDKYYGPKDDLKGFIDECHSRGIAVFMDMVLNHSYGQSPLVRMYFDPNAGEYGQPTAENLWYNEYSPNSSYSWGFDFNHESDYTKAFVDSVNSYWLTYYKVDGFRFDFTKGFTNTSGDGWNYDASRISILKRMANKIWEINSSAAVILEHFTDNTEEKELADYGMLIWGNINDEYSKAVKGFDSDISWISYNERSWSSPNLVGYMESHDEERLMYECLKYGASSGSYDVTDTLTALKRMELAVNFFIPLPGPKMIWQFGELGYGVSIDYGCRVCNKPIMWEYYDKTERLRLFQVYKTLIGLKQKYDVFKTSDFTIDQDGKTKTINLNGSEMNVVILGNFDVTAAFATANFPSTGDWYELYTGDTLSITHTEEMISLAAGEYRLYSDVKLQQPDIISSLRPNLQSEAKQCNVYPNPSSGKFYFDMDDHQLGSSEIFVFDLNGQLKIKKQNNYQNILEIDASELKSGLYFYRIVLDGEVYTGKIMKQ